MSKDFEAGIARSRAKEQNTQKGGRGMGAAKQLKRGSGNPTKGGGINRATKSK